MSTKWHKGPPPSVGWWPASIRGADSDLVRWWNGRVWSVAAMTSETAGEAARIARIKSDASALVLWRHRPASWPARSRT